MTTTGHLSDLDVEAIGRELDAIRVEVIASLDESDAAYIRRVIAVQRGLEIGGRAALLVSLLPPAWLAGAGMLTLSKILENMELGHNILHGQWDWMRDPRIHSATWEWDHATPAADWKHSHNYVHHTFTNVIGKDRDVGYGMLRMSEEQPWHPVCLLQPATNLVLAAVFEYGIAIYDVELEKVWKGDKSKRDAFDQLTGVWRKVRPQLVKDYLAFPLLSGPSAVPALLGNLTANLLRNVWTHTIIFCGHFPDGVEQFSEDQLEGETRGQWYLRQLLGSANIDGGPLFDVMTGNLSHQIEHHLFPDLPSNRYREIAPRIRDMCKRYHLPYTTGPLSRQYASMWRRVLRMSLPTPRRVSRESVKVRSRQIAA
jgi:NADPH-dependent stearoyl-CoA 9-desaturase